MHRSSSGRRDAMRRAHNAGRRKSAIKPDEGMTILEELPAVLQKQLKDLLEGEEDIKVAISTDLRLNGDYGKTG